MNIIKQKSAMVGAILFISGAAHAQAPVYNLSQDDLANKLENIERVVNSRTRSQQRVQEQINELQTELSEIRGKIEEQNFQIDRILQRQRELLLAFDIQSQQLQQVADSPTGSDSGASFNARPQPRTSEPAQQVPDNGLSSSVAQQAPVRQPTQPPVATAGEEEAYKSAVNLILRERNTQAAIPALENFAASYPNSRFKPNAHYWLGQIFYNERQWSQARTHFSTLVNNYPGSNKIPDATLKLGIIEKNLGNVAQARTILNQVMSNFPNSTSAQMAQQQLNTL